MKNIVVKIGDTVNLFNGIEGIINEIDNSVYQFTLSGDQIMWFHFRDIKQIINNDL